MKDNSFLLSSLLALVLAVLLIPCYLVVFACQQVAYLFENKEATRVGGCLPIY